MQDAYYAYRIVLKPWLWFLSRTTDCRIFANLSAPDIIKKIFEDDGCTGPPLPPDARAIRPSNTTSSIARLTSPSSRG